jgi:cysteine desulfurase / selenocysteine lyase
MSVDWQHVRAQFPALAGWTFLNTATFGQLPCCATEAVRRHFERRDQFACTDFLDWFSDADGIREQAARLVHCRPSDIAFIPNASSGLSLLLGGIDWKAGDRVVTLEHEFPNHYYFPQLLRYRDVEFVETCWEHFYDAITSRTRLVAISTVNYTTGFRAPLDEIAPFLRERGVLLYLDGTQSVGALEFACATVRPDLFAVDAYKWLLSPNGAGFMYVSPALRERLQPNVIGWRSHRDWRNHENLHQGLPEFNPDAERYEGGMLSFAPLYGMAASIQMMLGIGPQRIEQRVMELAEATRAVLRRAGARLLYDEAPHFDSPVIAAQLPGADSSRLVRELRARRVVVSARHGYLRVSPHFYNDVSDLDQFACALEAVRGRAT